MREREFLGVAVANLDSADIHARFIRVDAEAGEEHLEHVGLADFVARDHGAVHEHGNVFVLVAEHQIRVFVLAGDSVPDVPEVVLDFPAVAQGVAAVFADGFRGELRAGFLRCFLHREGGEKFLPFLLERPCGQRHVGGRERECVDLAAGAGDKPDRLVGRLVALACHVEECARDAESLFGVGLGERTARRPVSAL